MHRIMLTPVRTKSLLKTFRPANTQQRSAESICCKRPDLYWSRPPLVNRTSLRPGQVTSSRATFVLVPLSGVLCPRPFSSWPVRSGCSFQDHRGFLSYTLLFLCAFFFAQARIVPKPHYCGFHHPDG